MNAPHRNERPIPTVLIVEDEALILMMVAGYLSQHGFRVLEASSMEQAVRFLEGSEHVDLVFSDIRIPGRWDGIRLARWIKSRWPDIKVLLTSAADYEADARSIADGTFVRKPYEPEQVERQLRGLVETGRERGAVAG